MSDFGNEAQDEPTPVDPILGQEVPRGKVALRRTTTFVSDDGRRVDVIEKVGDIARADMDRTETCAHVDARLPVHDDIDLEYVGFDVITVGKQIQTIRFDIPAQTLEQAFDMFDARVDELLVVINANLRKQQSQIVTAPAGTLEVLDAQRPIDPRIVL